VGVQAGSQHDHFDRALASLLVATDLFCRTVVRSEL